MRWLLVFLIAFLLFNGLRRWLERIGLGRLPGDIFIRRGNFTFYFPLATSIIVSIVLTLLMWLFRK